jgi:hypothetical protein
MAGRRAGRVFRLSGVPLDWDQDRLQDFLAQQDALRLPDGSAFAPHISFPFCDVSYPETKTAMVTLHDTPPSLRRIPKLSMRVPESPAQPQASQAPVRSRFIKLDDEFIGLTTLFSPQLGHHEVE